MDMVLTDLDQWLSERKEKINGLREMVLNGHFGSDDEPSPFLKFIGMFDFFNFINERILFKRMTYTHEGIVFLSDGGQEVPIWTLSSGEQHLLMLYYKLLFEIEPDTLVMIDEPELSMNVVWQRNFLKDLQRITELRKFDVLIATHSPQIIHDKWDWMVPLGAKVDD